MPRLLRVPLLLALCALCLPAEPAIADTEHDVPIPQNPTFDDLLAFSSEEGNVNGLAPGAATCASAPHREISLPADDGPHNESEFEFWWWYGHLAAPGGRRFAYTVALAAKPWANYYGIDYTVEDLSSGKFHYGREAMVTGKPRGEHGRFRAEADDVRIAGSGGSVRLRFAVDAFQLALSIQPGEKRPILHFGDGHFSAYCNNNYWYSRVRMPTRARLTGSDRSWRLSGSSTLHRQWGFLPGEAVGVIDYDWLTFELEDGRDIGAIVASSRYAEQAVTAHTGYISDRRGRVRILGRGDFTLTPTRYWHRDETCSYPVEWDLEVGKLQLHAAASIDAAELRSTNTPTMFALWPDWALAWDGETIVTGDARGRGWLDMLGYCAV